MPQLTEDPNQQDTSTELVLAGESNDTLTMRQRFANAIGRTVDKVNDAVWQPILKRLEAFQTREKEAEVGRFRGKLREFFDSDTYRSIDTWVLTYFSIFGPHALEYLAAKTGTRIDEGTKEAFFEYLRLGLAGGFAADTVGNTVAKGSRYWFNVSDKLKPDGSDPERKKMDWEPAPLINLAGIAGSLSTLDGLKNVRLARLLKMARLSKVARLANQAGNKHSLEDEGTELINKSFTRAIVIIIASISAITTGVNLDYTQGEQLIAGDGPLALIAYAIKKHFDEIRTDIANVFTRRFKQADQRILAAFDNDPQLSFLGTQYREGGNEIDQLEDRVIRLTKLNQELVNPLGEELELNEHGELITKFVERTVMFTDVRGFTDLCNHYPTEKTEPMSAAYFSDMYPIVNRHGGRFANLMGDGAAIFFKDRLDEETGKVTPASELAVLCAIDLGAHSAKYDEIFRREMPLENKAINHKTGIAINSGPISVSDPFRKRAGKKGIRTPQIQGDTVNTAARVESLNKTFPGHTLLVTHTEYSKFSEELQALFVLCGRAKMKGLGEADIWGIPEPSSVVYDVAE